MRENIAFKNRLSLFYSVFKTSKVYSVVVLKVLKNADIEIFDLKTQKDGFITFSVKNKDEKKVFAISKELWYNKDVVKKIGNKGLFFPVYDFFCHVGLALGVLFFIGFTIFSSNFVLEFEFNGSGSVYKREVVNILKENGVFLYKNLNGIDLDKLSDKILSSSDNISFVEVKKEGLRLIIYLAKKESPATPSAPVYFLNSSVSGVVKELKVYRGNATVEVGSLVNAGDVLVEGYFVSGEEKIKTPVIAYVVIREKKTFTYTDIKELEESELLALASQTYSEDYALYNVIKTQNNNEIIYTVELFYDIVTCAT